jgi:Thoeris protein ThsB, TIR-like domain
MQVYDIFITHAWRYHDDWIKLSNLLDAHKSIKWRNFSVPWYDPALDPNTALGARAIRSWLDGQIRPVIGTILLDSVYAVKSARKWLDLEIELSRAHAKPVLAIPAYSATSVSREAIEVSDGIAAWNAAEIIESLEKLRTLRPE